MVYFGRAAVFSKSVLPRPLAAFGSVHRPGRRFVCELGDRIPDPVEEETNRNLYTLTIFAVG